MAWRSDVGHIGPTYVEKPEGHNVGRIGPTYIEKLDGRNVGRVGPTYVEKLDGRNVGRVGPTCVDQTMVATSGVARITPTSREWRRCPGRRALGLRPGLRG